MSSQSLVTYGIRVIEKIFNFRKDDIVPPEIVVQVKNSII